MSRPFRNEDDAYVERLARKLDTVPPRRDASGVFPRRTRERAPAGPPAPHLDEPFVGR